MKMKTLMSPEPFLHFLVFMGAIVIQNQMQLLIRHILVQSSEKLEKLLVTMSGMALPDNFPSSYV